MKRIFSIIFFVLASVLISYAFIHITIVNPKEPNDTLMDLFYNIGRYAAFIAMFTFGIISAIIFMAVFSVFLEQRSKFLEVNK